jgi:hypothetical protein
MRITCSNVVTAVFALSLVLVLSTVATAATVANPICQTNIANFNPTLSPAINVPAGFQVSVFTSALSPG